MASSLLTSFAEHLGNGFRRKSIVTCSKWAERCRIMGKPFPGPYSYKYFPWAREIHDCEDELWVMQKCAQIGGTEIVLNRVFYTIDIKRVDCLYLLPSQTPDATQFSAGRFAPALEMSPYLSSLFSDTDNVGHKRAGSTNLYIRGTRSRAQLKSVPAGLIVFDEMDEMTQDNLPLAEQRQSGQMFHQSIKLSTPTIAGHGINKEYTTSTQERFNFKCPHCSRWTELRYPECIVIPTDDLNDPKIKLSHLICKECKATRDHATKHEWLTIDPAKTKHGANDIARFVTNNVVNSGHRGFHVHSFYSSADARHPSKIAARILKSRIDPIEEQEMWNSDFGEVHEVKGARVKDEDILACQEFTQSISMAFNLRPKIQPGTLVTMGVDPGAEIHYEICSWHPVQQSQSNVTHTKYSSDISFAFIPRLIDYGSVREFDYLDDLMRKWQVRGCCIDGETEKRLGLEFAYRFPGFVHLVFYVEGVSARNLNEWANEPSMSVDRTSWLDLSLGRFRTHKILLPADLTKEYRDHIKAPVRQPGRDKHGNPNARYITADRVADHLAHCRNYSEIALMIATNPSNNKSMVSPR